MDILVLGSGVSGLTTAIALQRAGHSVRIWAKTLPPDVTSAVAAAVWYPYRAYPIDRVTRWGAEAYRAFNALAARPGTGVIHSEVLELLGAPSPNPEWSGEVEGFRPARPDEIPDGYAAGFAFRAPVIDMSVYLGYLQHTFAEAGGIVEERALTSLDDAFAANRVVVNCVGLGARELVADDDIHPARGQVLRIAPNGFRRVLLDDTGPNKVAYIVPRQHDIILGGVDDDFDARLTPDESQSASILRRCAALVEHFDAHFAASLRALLAALPIAAGKTVERPTAVEPARLLGVAVGLRPVRCYVRLEAKRLAPDRLLLHNYGHGGAGVTLSWGCAAEVVELLARESAR